MVFKSDFRALCLTLLRGQRAQDYAAQGGVDEAAAEAAADRLHEAGEAKWGTSEEVFIEVLAGASPQQAAAIVKAYENKHDRSLGKAIRNEFAGSVRNALLALIASSWSDWYAARLKAAFKGIGTADRTVCRIFGTHDKDGVQEIAAAYERKYGRPLKQDVKAECSGNTPAC